MEPKTYTTPNIYLAACFKTAGMKMIGPPDRTDPKRVKFTFEGVNIESTYEQFMAGTLTGNLKDLCENLRTIKMELWSSND
jgi:hypothetical protein